MKEGIKQRFAKVWFMLLCALTVINLCGLTTSAVFSDVAVYANGDDIGNGNNSSDDDATIKPEGTYTFEDFIAANGGSYTFPADWTALQDDDSEAATALKNNFKNSNEYMTWLNKAKNNIDGDGNTLKAQPKNISNITDTSGQEYATAWAKYNSSVSKFNSIMTRHAYNKLTNDVFGRDFNPTNAITLAFQDSFAMACNTIFNIAAQALMLLFLVQTAFDVLYLVIPALQPILGAANSSSAPGGGSAGVAKGGSFKLQFNLVSNEAIDAANRSSTGTTGGAGSGSITETVIALKYIINRAPTFILAASYIVLAVTGIWPKIISAVSAFVAQIFNALI